MSRKLCFVLLVVMMLTMLSACGKPRKVPTIEMEEAQFDLESYCMTYPSVIDTEEKFFFDINGDGADEICTSVLYGSRFTRTNIVVYDVYNKKYYTLGDDLSDFEIVGVEKNRLVVMQNYSTLGTVKFSKDGKLEFIADKV